MSLLDAASAGLRAGGGVLERADTERFTDLTERVSALAADIDVTEIVSAVVSAADQVGDRIATVVEHRGHPSRTTRLALAAGILVVVLAGAMLIRRRRKSAAHRDSVLDGPPVDAANPN